MDTFVDSSWYFLRYTAPHLTTAPVRARGRRLLAAGRPVHRRHRARDPAPALRALLHQGAARRAAWSARDEPFARLFTQGMIYRDGAKMSKSRGNVVAPGRVVERFGADTLRLYVLFMGPAADDAEWSDRGVEGSAASIDRLWRLVGGLEPARRRPSGRSLRRRCEATRSRSSWCARPRRRSPRSPTTSASASRSTPPSRRSRSWSTWHEGRVRGADRRRRAPGRPCATRPGPRSRCCSRSRPTSPASCGRRWAAGAVARAVARGRPGLPGARHGHGGRAGQRQAARAPGGAGGPGPDAELVARARDLPRVASAVDGREVVREVVVPDRLVNLVLG